MAQHMSIDIETYSSADLKTCGLHKYVRADDFQILLFAYAFEDERVQLVDLTAEKLPEDVRAALYDPEIIKHAYNASFEIEALSHVFGELALEQWRCTMLHGLYCGLTAGLGITAEVLGVQEGKMREGDMLIRYFSKPCKATKSNLGRTRNLPQHDPEKWDLFGRYCMRDVEVEREIERCLSAFPIDEDTQQGWLLDQKINRRGVLVDRDLVDGAVACDGEAKAVLLENMQELTGLENPSSPNQMKRWLEDKGLQVTSLAKDAMPELLERSTDPCVAEVLAMYGEAKLTTASKYQTMQNAAGEDDRVRGLLQFYGANRTGRWAGRLVQVQNLAKNYIPDVDLARSLVKKRDREMLDLLYGSASDILKQLVRTAFIAPEGKKLVVVDFSAIEARVIAWWAGEKWRLDVFAGDGKIYEASASQMFGVPVEKIVKGQPEYALRQKGKVAELACGYQGNVKALEDMGALKMGLPKESLPDIIKRWRAASPAIVRLWEQVELAAKSVVAGGREKASVRGVTFQCEENNQLRFLTVLLPSGRKLYYARPSIDANRFGRQALYYEDLDQQTRKWRRNNSYGGKLVENIVQAMARDCLDLTLKRVDVAGFEILMHIHDEIVVETDDPDALEKLEKIMEEAVPWAADLQLTGDGFVSEYYRKD